MRSKAVWTYFRPIANIHKIIIFLLLVSFIIKVTPKHPPVIADTAKESEHIDNPDNEANCETEFEEESYNSVIQTFRNPFTNMS